MFSRFSHASGTERFVRVVRAGRCGGGASGRGASVWSAWRGVHDTPYEDSPYRPRNLLKEEEEAKPATHDMPEIPYFLSVILPYFIPVIRR